jgi:hypothetical protein
VSDFHLTVPNALPQHQEPFTAITSFPLFGGAGSAAGLSPQTFSPQPGLTLSERAGSSPPPASFSQLDLPLFGAGSSGGLVSRTPLTSSGGAASPQLQQSFFPQSGKLGSVSPFPTPSTVSASTPITQLLAQQRCQNCQKEPPIAVQQ